jgi:hypothetical protein
MPGLLVRLKISYRTSLFRRLVHLRMMVVQSRLDRRESRQCLVLLRLTTLGATSATGVRLEVDKAEVLDLVDSLFE